MSASKKRKSQRSDLQQHIKRWPAEMTSKQYNKRLALLASLNARNRASLARLIRRHGYVTFDTQKSAWINHTIETSC